MVCVWFMVFPVVQLQCALLNLVWYHQIQFHCIVSQKSSFLIQSIKDSIDIHTEAIEKL